MNSIVSGFGRPSRHRLADYIYTGLICSFEEGYLKRPLLVKDSPLCSSRVATCAKGLTALLHFIHSYTTSPQIKGSVQPTMIARKFVAPVLTLCVVQVLSSALITYILPFVAACESFFVTIKWRLSLIQQTFCLWDG
jgi:hypothetical protein